MPDTGEVISIDLNADLAESDQLMASDLAILDVVTSANLACGFHAGSASAMRAAADACLERGVVIGAHVSYRDRAGFGRRRVDVSLDALAADVGEQWAALESEATRVGAEVTYLKAHGALYHAVASNSEVAAAVIGAVGPMCRTVVLPPHSQAVEAATHAGLRVVLEGFPDRGYTSTGALAERDQPGALVHSVDEVGDRARSMALDSGVTAVDGTWLSLPVETLCIHGDHPDAPDRARAVRSALESAGVQIATFDVPDLHTNRPS